MDRRLFEGEHRCGSGPGALAQACDGAVAGRGEVRALRLGALDRLEGCERHQQGGCGEKGAADKVFDPAHGLLPALVEHAKASSMSRASRAKPLMPLGFRAGDRRPPCSDTDESCPLADAGGTIFVCRPRTPG